VVECDRGCEGGEAHSEVDAEVIEILLLYAIWGVLERVGV